MYSVRIPLCVFAGGGVQDTFISVAETVSAEIEAGLLPGAAIKQS